MDSFAGFRLQIFLNCSFIVFLTFGFLNFEAQSQVQHNHYGSSGFTNFPQQQQYYQQQSQYSSQVNFPQSQAGNNYGNPSGSNSGNNNGQLQQMFTDMFDWNRDLRSDPRFQKCRVPDISQIAQSCPQKDFYFGMNPGHRKAVMLVKQIMMGSRNPMEAVCAAGAIRDLPGMNPNAWIRGVVATTMARPDLYALRMPPMVEIMPNTFINSDSMEQARRQNNFAPQSRTCVVVDGNVGRDNGIENLLWYWREDVMVNSFHLNWHLTYPFTGTNVRADRRGELFYFSHHSHLARYHAERLSNGLGRVIPLNVDYNVRVPEPYHPHLTDSNSQLNWSPRGLNAVFQDTQFTAIQGVPPNISMSRRSQYLQNIEQAIFNRALFTPNGQSVRLDTLAGVDLLGDIIEASVFSLNPNLYGPFGVHNDGHVLLSLIEDPQNRLRIPPGVMLEVSTSMRDPVFYTYHTPVNDIFDRHKQTLIPYAPTGGEFPLIWPGVEISHLHVSSQDGGHYNNLKTFFKRKEFDLSRGLDFNRTSAQGSIRACVKHLDHYEFDYEISVNRQSNVASNRATVRIFLAPRFDENGQRYTINEQRRLFFILDVFTANLRVGQNLIKRSSLESTLTITIPQSLHEVTIQKPMQRPYCGCGWPHHLLIPKGTREGMIFDLFVMLTNGDEDIVPAQRSRGGQGECKPAPVYCGRLNDTYPDRRPMGYPFDRLPYNAGSSGGQQWWQKQGQVETLEDYVNGIPNMAAIQVKITHLGDQDSQQQEVVDAAPSFSAPNNRPLGNVNFRELIPRQSAPSIYEETSAFRAGQNYEQLLPAISPARTVQFGSNRDHGYQWAPN